ncbi:MAG TPA: hypothetical protein PKE69_22820 [Pyrinomonadaceae bacterium]|nr:hypothetical protein [Pyrinomonadaceae bacterium]
MSKVESADLIMKLYDLRREDKMREARGWFVAFFPESTAEVMQAMINAETSAAYRMVTTYWDMAAAFINHGAIDEAMFSEITGEHIVVFSKIEPFIEELRATMGENYLKNLEALIMKQPNAKEMLAARRELMKRWMQARAAQG